MNKQLKQLTDFHKVFEVPFLEKMGYPNIKVAQLRASLIQEEGRETIEELLTNEDNIDKIAKELCDLLYVTFGTIISYGLQDKIEQCFDEVHKSNMSKLLPCKEAINDDGTCVSDTCEIFHRKPLIREDGKILKSNMYVEADIKKILNSND